MHVSDCLSAVRPLTMQSPRYFSSYLVLTVFLCGAVVMAIEVLAARVIAPFFGSSIFVWTAVISVTLLSLALGYFVGGKLADHLPAPAGLYAAIALSAAYLFLALFIKKPVLLVASSLGLRLGALLSSAALFALPLFLLGIVGPFSVKLYARSLERVGSGVGVLYFFSTAGSFLGTLLCGFVLIPRFGTARILLFSADTLVALSLLYFLFFGRHATSLLLLALVPLNVSALKGEVLLVSVVNGDYWKQVYKAESFYTNLKIVEVNAAGRFLVTDGTNQGGVDILTGASQAAYSYAIDALSLTGCPSLRRALVIGLGAGVVPCVFSHRGIKVDVVEIDPQVVALYKRYFSAYGRKENIRIFTEDGRRFLKGRPAEYDVVVLDVFVGDNAPWHLLTVEAFLEMEAALTKEGALVINFVGLPEDKDCAKIISAIHTTLARVFPSVYVFNSTRALPERARNILFLAALGEPTPGLPAEVDIPYPHVREEVEAMLRDRVTEPVAGGFLLTDDYNPVDFYNARAKEFWRKTIMGAPSRQILLE